MSDQNQSPLKFSGFQYKPSRSLQIANKLGVSERNVRAGIRCLFVALIVLTVAMFTLVSFGNEAVAGIIFQLLFFGLILYVFFLAMLSRDKNRLLLERFANDNGFTYVKEAEPSSQPGVLFTVGHSRRLGPLIRGTYAGRPFTMFQYNYTVGSGKNRQTRYFSVATTRLARKVPHVVMDSKANNFANIFSNLPALDGSQELQLEGDFNSYFKVYVPSGYGRDALYFLTPELMALLVDTASKYDMEAVDDTLYFYSNYQTLDERFLKEAFPMLQSVGGEMVENTQRYADERVGQFTANTIAPQGQRLKSGINWLVIVVVGLFFVLQVLPNILMTLWNLFGR